MPQGGFRRNAGRPKLPAEHHARKGTYRPALHGPLATVLPMPQAAVLVSWAPAAAELKAQGAAGRTFVTDWLERYDELTLAQGTLLLEAGHAVTALAAVRAVSRRRLTLKEHAALDRLEQQWSRILAMLIAQLDRGTA